MLCQGEATKLDRSSLERRNCSSSSPSFQGDGEAIGSAQTILITVCIQSAVSWALGGAE